MPCLLNMHCIQSMFLILLFCLFLRSLYKIIIHFDTMAIRINWREKNCMKKTSYMRKIDVFSVASVTVMSYHGISNQNINFVRWFLISHENQRHWEKEMSLLSICIMKFANSYLLSRKHSGERFFANTCYTFCS